MTLKEIREILDDLEKDGRIKETDIVYIDNEHLVFDRGISPTFEVHVYVNPK